MTGWSKGENRVEVTQGLVGLTDKFGDDAGLTQQARKCRRFATDAATRAALAELPGPPVADWFLDLGVVQVAGEEDRSGERAPRVVGAFARLSRIACIPLPFSKKTHFSASSALSSSCYGLASGPVVAEEIEDLRRAVKQATLRGPKFASTLSFFGCLGLSWRIDAGAQALLAPWFVLHRAYGSGRLDADKLGWL